MIEQVKGVRAEQDAELLLERELARDGEIHIVESTGAKCVAARIAKRKCSGHGKGRGVEPAADRTHWNRRTPGDGIRTGSIIGISRQIRPLAIVRRAYSTVHIGNVPGNRHSKGLTRSEGIYRTKLPVP